MPASKLDFHIYNMGCRSRFIMVISFSSCVYFSCKELCTLLNRDQFHCKKMLQGALFTYYFNRKEKRKLMHLHFHTYK